MAILLAFALWPAVHFALVRMAGLSPWKLHGMAMYCQPKLKESALLYDLIGRRKRMSGLLASEDVRSALDEYLRQRRYLGRLASEKELERVLVAAMGRRDGVLLEIEHWKIGERTHVMEREFLQILFVNRRLDGLAARKLQLEYDFIDKKPRG